MRHLTLALGLLLIAAPAWAQGPVNPSQITWMAPTTNADTPPTPLTDLAGYNIRVAGPLGSPTAPCPAFTPAAYPVRANKVSAVTSPSANRVEAFGTAGSRNLAGDLGLTADGAYCASITAVDLAANEGGATGPAPFSRNVVAPGAPSGSQIVQ